MRVSEIEGRGRMIDTERGWGRVIDRERERERMR